MLQLFERCKLLLFLSVLALTAIGCQVAPQFETPTLLPSHFPSVAVTMTQKQISTASPTFFPIMTPIKTTPAPSATLTTEAIDFRTLQLCPSQTLSIQGLEIEKYRLLASQYVEKGETELKTEIERGYVLPSAPGNLVVSGGNLVYEPISLPEKPGWTLRSYNIEANGQQMRLLYKNDDNEQYALWRSSWDGQQQEKVYEYNSDGFYVREVDNMLLIYQENAENWLSKPYAIENLATGDHRILSTLPETDYSRAFVISDTLYILYGDVQSGEQFMLYNDAKQTIKPAFPWFRGKEWIWNRTTPIFQQSDRLSVYAFRPDGFDVAFDLSVDDILQLANYTDVMKGVHVPIPDNDELMTMGSEIRQLDNGIIFHAELFDSSEARIYHIDFNNKIIKDYCLSLQSMPSIAVSPDGRFIAITNYYGDNPLLEHLPAYPTEVILLDIETGQRVRIQDPYFEVIGWGITPDSPK